MTSGFLHIRLGTFGNRPALSGPWGTSGYDDLYGRITAWQSWLEERDITPGSSVAYVSRYESDDIALFFALAIGGQISVPCAPAQPIWIEKLCAAAHADFLIRKAADGTWINDRFEAAPHPLLDQLRAANEAGLILFSSGSTGIPKATLLSLDRLLARHATQRSALTTLAFLDGSHIGGVNTVLHTICHGACLVVPRDRTPATVCARMARHRVAVLPTTPSFLNLLLMSGEIERYNLSALRVVTYGTECMPQSTLNAVVRALPGVRLKQTYGSTELGILPTRSADDGSRWINIGGSGFDLRVRDGRLIVRGPAQMLGYLNASQAFDEDGWYDTGDLVEEKDGMFRIVGRESEVINVGGQKVLPGEVENCLLQAGNVLDAVVEGRPNPVTGHVVTARIVLREAEEAEAAEARIWSFCRARLDEYKIPVLFRFTKTPLHSTRFKRLRKEVS